MREHTLKNIEDWDFRSWRSPLREGGESPEYVSMTFFLEENFLQVLAIDVERSVIVSLLLDKGYGSWSDDKEDVVLTSEGVAVLPHLSSWRDSFTRAGRSNRRIVRSLVREWQKNGRLRFSVLPDDLRGNFPALSSDESERRFSRAPDDPG